MLTIKFKFDKLLLKSKEVRSLNTHGGKREGAGRKLTGRKPVSFYITKEEAEKLRKFLLEMRCEDETNNNDKQRF
jgi:hypothetical protein